MITKESSFAGFLDGYQSRNIATIENKFHYKLTDITETISLLLNDLRNAIPPNHILITGLEKNCKINRESNYSNLMEQLYKLGEFLKQNIDVFNTYNNLPNQDIYMKVKIIVINFLELAKISEDSRLIHFAIEIGAKFQY